MANEFGAGVEFNVVPGNSVFNAIGILVGVTLAVIVKQRTVTGAIAQAFAFVSQMLAAMISVKVTAE